MPSMLGFLLSWIGRISHAWEQRRDGPACWQGGQGQNEGESAASTASLSAAKRHQAEVKNKPNRDCKSPNGLHPLPGPGKVMGLDGINCDHEIVAEPGPPKERAVFGIAPP